MRYIQYPAQLARANNTKSGVEAKVVYFNAIMAEIQAYSALQATHLDVHEVSAFQNYGLQPMFEAQGYVVSYLGTPDNVIKYTISWE